MEISIEHLFRNALSTPANSVEQLAYTLYGLFHVKLVPSLKGISA